ncbi:alpha/beta-hydrolase [Wilcoxina mikolae CBS 423.85]|nr:alpha/beta-hydrolase [Wilcoxina mikolae CBS 423.85]
MCLSDRIKIPGYGESTKSVPTSNTEAYSKHAIGRDILDGLAKYLGLDGRAGKQKVILLGHDRGARISQRIAFDIDKYPLFEIIGACLADIVPITVQFASLGNPTNAASTFHWAFLAGRYPIPETMIEKSGGSAWVKECLTAWSGTPEQSQSDFAQGAEVYKEHFNKTSVIHASCADYRAAAHIDAPLEAKEHAEGRKIGIPTLVLYSKKYLGSRYDVPAVWKEWVSGKTNLTTHGFDEIGHYCFEEDPESSYRAFNDWTSDVLEVRV